MAIGIAKTTVSRSLMGRGIVGFVPEPIADTADRLHGCPAEWAVDLVAEVADVDIDDVRITLEREVPDVLQQLRPGQRFPRVLHQVLEERELLRREVDLPLATVDR